MDLTKEQIEFDLMIWEMIKWLKDNPNVTLDEIGVKYEDIDTLHGKITIIKTEIKENFATESKLI